MSISRRAGSDEAWLWSSDGKGTYTIAPVDLRDAPARGTRVVLHLMEDAKAYTERYTLERIVRAHPATCRCRSRSCEKPGAEPTQIADGARAVDQAEERDQPRTTTPTSTAASPASSTSRR